MHCLTQETFFGNKQKQMDSQNKGTIRYLGECSRRFSETKDQTPVGEEPARSTLAANFSTGLTLNMQPNGIIRFVSRDARQQIY